MANYCINCGKKIGLYDEYMRLTYTEGYFCKNCMKIADQLLTGIKTAISYERLEAVKKEFAEAFPTTSLNEKAKQAIKEEFEQQADIADHQIMRVENSREMKKLIRIGFDEAKQAILKVGQRLCGAGPTAGSDQIKIGDVTVGVFIYENYFFRNGSYASLTVVLVSQGNTSTILTVGSGGGDGILGLSWGAEADFEFSFWDEFRQLFPEYSLKDCPVVMNEKNRIGILGGTFDPVHNGHLALAKGAMEAASLKRLIVMPAKVQPFKLGKEIAEDSHRLAMVRAAFADDDRVEVSDYEICHTYISYTYDTLMYLKELYPEDELFFILGTDSFLDVEYWHKGIELLEKFSFIVGSRPGYRENELDDKIKHYGERYHTSVIKVEDRMPDISSTMIKERIRNELPVSNLIPENVERYIHDQRLYL